MQLQPASSTLLPLKRSRSPRKQRYSAARAFYLTILVISALAIWSATTEKRAFISTNTPSQHLRRSELTAGDAILTGNDQKLVRRDESCRLVHNAKDQCAFVLANCPDEEAGLFSYLQLYYCNLHNAKPIAFTILVLWLGLLFSTIGIAASDFFCINLSTIASILGMSESMAGVTFLAFGNGSPDVFSTFAAMKSHSGSLAVGELIGAAGFITSVVAGSMALVRPFKVARKSFVRDVGFFIVAASFSMVFLADGHLHMWECAVMVAFYVFYVITVVVWHWVLRQRSRRKIQEDAARSQFHIPGTDEAEYEPYVDDEDGPAAGSSATPGTDSANDFANLERGGSPMIWPLDEEADADDETRDRYLAEISSNMRVSRPSRGGRRNTINPIRPSLVGALEFSAVLSSLQKSRNIQAIPINLRRYSDDPEFSAAHQSDRRSSISNPVTTRDDPNVHDAASNVHLRPNMDAGPHRVRAVSANDALGLRLDPDTLQRPPVPQIGFLGPSPPGSAALPSPDIPRPGHRVPPKSPVSPSPSLSPPSSDFGYLASSPAPMSPIEAASHVEPRKSDDFLAPPGNGFTIYQDHDHARSDTQHNEEVSPRLSPKLGGKPTVPRIEIPRSTASSSRRSSVLLSPYPAYHDDPNFVPSSRAPSIRLPPSSVGSESTFHQHLYQDQENKENPMRWWPYPVLPTPHILLSTLLPTLYSWNDKNIWEKMLGLVAAPSVFLLAITLPIVEVNKEDEDEPELVDPDSGLRSPHHTLSRSESTVLAQLPPDSPSKSNITDLSADPPKPSKNSIPTLNSPAINVTSADSPNPTAEPQPSFSAAHSPPSPKEWNRWLVATQLFTSPLFIVLLFWANTTPKQPRLLLLPALYALLASLVALTLLLLLTSPTKPPKHRHILCFFGFIVSIAWISTIANEVVGVLKAFGVILGISDAILGLTIFAVGNSLGDLVADITVASLGYPVMALSACFGGPMLNILLGIGLSGLYMTIRSEERRHDKHPERPIRYKPYQVEVGGTLLISGVTLLVTLVGLLVVVPLRGWRMDRKVGSGLVALWGVSTVLNVVVEGMGWARKFG